ncbi:MHS family alpha-ketoglutarate permease-like MFS transporter [Sphingomonas kyeonggiensis]|uniref:MHS family alpha-ketoglutarate permease-like MFS transporter n=1 Tax=Sphingomonas kyeonggiensis TaxID=1268553 RepID=A0A7W7K397_9SPHN|nr:MFS transporter [Sphingomonas kyeonggiensis]MBB4839803.1 MHS family alpha-ketoglutarate permease-like MFS transporter [Sphingomonas kyeonggiensis]
MTAADAATPPRHRLRSILGGSAGNLVEWYDWYAYAVLASYLAPHYFPKGASQDISAWIVFAIGFFMRPIGGWLMGIYGDRRGRKAGLTLSVTLMCAGSIIIAVTPSYGEIGVTATVALVTARLLQGLSLGGEYGASATYLSEMAGRKHRGFFSSFQYVTLISGQLVALLVLLVLQAVMSEADLKAWGWRIPFAVGGVLALGVFWLRRRLAETESFAKRETTKKSSALALVREHPREAAVVMLLTAGGTLAFYAYTIYPIAFLKKTAGFSDSAATQVNAAALFVFMAIQPLAGALSDRIGRKPLMIAFGVLGTLLSYPIFVAMEGARDALTAFLLMTGALVIVTGYTSINAVVKAELFPAHIRTLGVALPYALANALFGGTAPTVALWFKQEGWERGFYWYVTAMIAISLVTYLCMRDTAKHSQILED